MSGAKNSIIGDSMGVPAYAEPEGKKQTVRKSDWARLGKSRKFKVVDEYMEARKEYWRHFTPDGESFLKLYVQDPDAAARFAVIASHVIKEVDDLQYRIEMESR